MKRLNANGDRVCVEGHTARVPVDTVVAVPNSYRAPRAQ